LVSAAKLVADGLMLGEKGQAEVFFLKSC
jgi:hypothetical protein